jgi:putative nucleotidyltransferase with HDIG domain
MHVLIADDDRTTRRVIAKLLGDAGGFDLVEAEDGEQAWSLLGRTAFDLLLLDWAMPKKQGTEIVRELRGSGSRIPIIMVTAASQREKVVEALRAGVSDYVIKPFEPAYLLGKVARVRERAQPSAAGREACSTAGKEDAARPADGGKPLLTVVLGQIDDVSTIPEMAMRFLQAANDRDATVEDLQKLLTSDPAIAARVLRLVNSSAFSVRQKITNLHQAVAYLGAKPIRDLAVAISVNELFRVRGSLGSYSRTALWRHMVSVGICARLLAGRLGFPDGEDFFLAGLLHDIGIVLEDQYAHQQFCQVLRSAIAGKTLTQCEHEYLGFDHTALGQRVAERWKFPEAVQAAIRHHHDSTRCDGEHQRVVRCVELANVLCAAQGSTSVGINLLKTATPESLGLALGKEDLDALARSLNQELAALGSVFNA